MTFELLQMDRILDTSDLPGIDGEELPKIVPLELIEVTSNPKERTLDLEDDYTVVRKNLHFQQQMLMDAAKLFLESAKTADSPRHMEVFATLMGQFTTSNKELLKIHNDMKAITNENVAVPQGNGNVNIENAHVFVGSPTDFMEEHGDAFEASQRVISEQ